MLLLSRFGLTAFVAFLLSSCAGSPRPPAVGPDEIAAMPHHLDIYSEPQAATLHFPRGSYSLAAADKIGYYYRAPQSVTQHIGGGGSQHEGGIFVSRRDQRKLRGYVYLAGGVTLVGNLSGVPHQFHD